MKKLLITLLYLFTFSSGLLSQNVVSGMVFDKESSDIIPGVNITYKIDSIQYGVTTSNDGSFVFLIPKGKNILVTFSFIGYKSQSKLIVANGNNKGLKIYLSESVTELNDVVVNSNVTILLQRGDTIVYKADNIKTNPDATGLDLIRRLPGISYKDNKLEAQGRTVSEVRVDGKEFYKYDVETALRNLPKDIVNEIKLFEELSDYAKLSGVDDGSETMIIDVTTKNGSEGSTFGKASGGYGTDDRFSLYGVFNQFGKKNRISVFSQFNNINEQNFSSIDLLGTTGIIASSDPTQSPFSRNAISNSFSHTENDEISSMMTSLSSYGITNTSAVGLNYSGESYNKKLKYSGHYIFNVDDNSTLYDIYDEYFGETVFNNRQHQSLDNNNLNHRFILKLEYQPSTNNYFMIRPSFVIQKRDQNSDLNDLTVEKMDTDSGDEVDFRLGSMMKDSLLLNQLTLTNQDALSTSNEVMFLHRFEKQGHSLSVDAKLSYTDTEETMSLELSNIQAGEYVLQNTDSKNNQHSYAATISYTVPTSKFGRIKIDAGFNKEFGHIKQATETNLNHAETFKIDSMLCGRANSHYGGLLANASYIYDRKRWNIVVGTEFDKYRQWTENDREIVIHNYNKALPYIFISYKKSNLRWNFRYKTSQLFPTVYQLLEAINNSNSIMSIKGNNRLEASYHHNISSRLILSNSDVGSHFVFFTNFEIADNYIGSRRSLSSTSWVNDARHRNSEMYSYANVDDYWSATGLLAYGFPVNPIKSNVNISTMIDYGNIPGYWDKDKLINKQWNWNGFLTIGSNISEKIDFVIDSNVKYNQCTNMAYKKMNISYWSVSYGAQLKWVITSNLPITIECGKTNYLGSDMSQFNALIGNIAIGYKLFKQKNGELLLTCHDVFNQDNSFLHTTTELYRRQMTTSLLKRYYMLKFTYSFNSIKKAGN